MTTSTSTPPTAEPMPLAMAPETAPTSFRGCAVIPTYNHVDRLAPILEVLASHKLHSIVVNDASDAPTRERLEALINNNPAATLLHHAENKGKGGAVKTGLRHANSKGFTHALQIDADGQHDTDEIGAMLQKAQTHPEALILGRPVFDESIPKGRLYPRYITHVWVWIETLSLELQDSMCGFRVYPLASTVALLDRVETGDRMDFDIEIAVRLFWENIPFVPHDTAVKYHPEGGSHFRLFHDNLLISWLHTRLFFGMCWRAPWLLLRRRRRVQEPPPALEQPMPADSIDNADTKHWMRTRERGSVWGIKFVMGLYRIMGRSVTMAFLWPILGYFFLTGRQARAASLLYLRRLYAFEGGKDALPRPPDKRMAFRHFLEFGRAALDKLSAWLGDIKRAHIDWPNRHLLLELLDKGQGAVLIGAHLGNIEVLRAIAEDNPRLKMNVLVFTKHAAQFNAMVKALNPSSQVALIPVDEISIETGVRLKACIARGEMVAILADRVPEGTATRAQRVPFLGHSAAFPEGPFILASLLDCPAYLLFCLRSQGERNYNEYEIVLEPFAERIKLPRKTRKEALRAVIEAYAKRLEATCLRAPLQWFNFYDFWRDADAPPTLPLSKDDTVPPKADDTD